ncbi:MAG: sulfite exporter TauE/SafE family protein [Crocinitomicaceae bacterium]|nr:sulfite exporter TauE/SafE family protein [Crocinitomicaceae bacterium]NGF76707.1 sulfite exporter TauE/SafE family protein [Fluviicola sp. SGL-29]
MDIAGYFASIFIGIFLGLIGGGGSILTVPVLVYLFRIDAVMATTYSLFIVAVTSMVGSRTYLKRGFVNKQTVLSFGLPSIVVILLTRKFVLPAIPENIVTIGTLTVTKSVLLLLLFALLMIAAAYRMISKKNRGDVSSAENKRSTLILQGILVGFVTGLVGAGGGFLIIPALVNIVKLPMKTAVGTSLVIIAVNSLSGFLFSLDGSPIDWQFLLTIALFAVGGIFIGTTLSKRMDGAQLKPVFGWFVLIMGMYIILKELLLK